MSVSVDKAKKKTTVYYEDDYPAFDDSESRTNTITISEDRSYQAAMHLSKEYPGAKIAVMNFANAFHAGVIDFEIRQNTCFKSAHKAIIGWAFFIGGKDMSFLTVSGKPARCAAPSGLRQ